MLADYCWSFIREALTGETKRQKKTKWVFNETETLFIIQ